MGKNLDIRNSHCFGHLLRLFCDIRSHCWGGGDRKQPMLSTFMVHVLLV